MLEGHECGPNARRRVGRDDGERKAKYVGSTSGATKDEASRAQQEG